MPLSDPLVLEFASRRPAELSALLANRDLKELAEFIAELPLESAAVLASQLPSWQLTGLLGVLDATLVSRLLSVANPNEAVALVSHLHESHYPAVLEATPESERAALYQLLQFPSHTLASLASTEFVRVLADTTCGVFCQQLSESAEGGDHPVLVVDARGRYRGILSLRAAYANRNRSRRAVDVSDPVEPLSGLTDAATALGSRQWAHYPELPVVDNAHRLIGVVGRVELERVAGDIQPGEFSLERLLGELATGYISTCGRVIESLLGKSS